MKTWHYTAAAIAALVAVSACDRPPQGQAPAAVADSVPEAWMGRWTGPEGTLLDLSRSGGVYTVKITSLDGPATYEGKGVGDHIEFQRDGKLETIRATNGQETGMKWLAEKTNCLTIRQSEGFCRD